MTTPERFEVRRQIAASPAAVFAVLSDPNGHVAIDSSGMLQSAEGKKVTAVGDEFVVHMDRESLNDYPMGKYDVTVIITKYQQDAEIEWTVSGAIQPPIRHLYGYQLEPSEIGTLVTTYYDWSEIREDFRDKGIFPVIQESALRATLGILARTVENQQSPHTAGSHDGRLPTTVTSPHNLPASSPNQAASNLVDRPESGEIGKDRTARSSRVHDW